MVARVKPGVREMRLFQAPRTCPTLGASGRGILLRWSDGRAVARRRCSL
jgi:hypothetical protein